jgi:hypothetical protein
MPARPDLSSDRRSEAEAANKAFTSSVQEIKGSSASDDADAASPADAAGCPRPE